LIRATTGVRVLFSALIVLCACSLVVDSSDLGSGCAEGQRLCFGECVAPEEAPEGCGPSECDGCEEEENAISACVDGECVVIACLDGFGCPSSNCVWNLLIDAENCGACGVECQTGQQCVTGKCEDVPAPGL
jgi:hypothetical protein